MNEEQVRAIIREEMYRVTQFLQNDKFVFDRNIYISTLNGLKIGTEGYVDATHLGQKIGFYGKTPVAQNITITSPAGGGAAGVDQPARNSVDEIKTFLTLIGLTR